MKRTFTLLIILVCAITANAQFTTLYDFEDGADTTTWIPFANGKTGTNSDINVVLNPLKDTVNSSDSVLMFIVHDDSDPWVGMYSDAFPVYITEESYILSMMVHKTISSSVRLKLELSLNSGTTTTIGVVNSLVDEWQLLNFDFSAVKGKIYSRLTVFPDFPDARTEGTVVYLDNIAIQDQSNTAVKEFEGAEMKIYPNPADYRVAVQYPEMRGVRISNIQGQEIRTVTFDTTNSKVLEIGDLKPGIYLATALTPKGNFTMQFIKK